MISIDREMLWQWDYGQRVQLHDVPVGTKVHFSNAAIKPSALVTEAYEDVEGVYANIPNILLQTAGTLTAYIYLEDGDEGHTEYRKMFIVRDREKPDDYVYTEDDVKTWVSLEERIKVLEESGGGAAGGLIRPLSEIGEIDGVKVVHVPDKDRVELTVEMTAESMHSVFGGNAVYKNDFLNARQLQLMFRIPGAGRLFLWELFEDDLITVTNYPNKKFIMVSTNRMIASLTYDDNGQFVSENKTYQANVQKVEEMIAEAVASLPQSDWNQSDETAPDFVKNRTHYEEVRETSIEGLTIGDFPPSTSGAAHNLNVPLALGQKWTIYKNNGSEEGVWAVQQAEDGTLFLGDSPVRITKDTIECNSSWVRMLNVTRVYIVGVSGAIAETTVKKIDPKFIPEWNELNGIPFGEETEDVTYLEPYTFDMTSTGNWVQLQFVNEIVVGTVLKVMWDGELYECIAHDTTGMVGFGNASLYGKNTEDTNEPFLVLFNGPSRWVAVTETGVHTISVAGNKTVVKQIDEKYIPDSIARKSDIPQGGGTSDIPSTLPNPHPLTFTGAVEATYDGSTPVEVEIPIGGSGGAFGEKLRLVADITLSSDELPARIILTEDMDGKAFSMRDFIIRTNIASSIANIFLSVNGPYMPQGGDLMVANNSGDTYFAAREGYILAVNGNKTDARICTLKGGPVTSIYFPAEPYTIKSGSYFRVYEVL